MTTKAPPSLLQAPYRKNTVINGVMDLWQRGTSEAVPTATVSRLCDMYALWYDVGAGRLSWLQSTDVPTVAQCGSFLNYSSELDITTAEVTPAAGKEASLGHNIEGYDYTTLAGKDATLSFWVKSNKTGIYSVAVRNFDKDRCYTVEYTIDIADTWEKKIVVFPFGDVDGTWYTTNGTGIRLDWCLQATSSQTSTFGEWITTNTPYSVNNVNLFDNTANYWRMAGVQFEAGSIATDIERRSIAEELALCQRYYWEDSSSSRVLSPYNTATMDVMIEYPVTMRTIPVLTVNRVNYTTPTSQTNANTHRELKALTLDGTSYYISSIKADASLE